MQRDDTDKWYALEDDLPELDRISTRILLQAEKYLHGHRHTTMPWYLKNGVFIRLEKAIL